MSCEEGKFAGDLCSSSDIIDMDIFDSISVLCTLVMNPPA